MHFWVFTELGQFPSLRGVLSVLATDSINILPESESEGHFKADFIGQYRLILCKCGEIDLSFHLSVMKLAQ